jgi:hypothetical protein
VKTIPKRLLRDSVSVETYTGESAYGPIYGAAATVLCMASSVRQLVRDAFGAEAVSSLTLYVHPDDEAKFTPETKVTTSSRVSTVIGVAPHRRPGETVLVEVNCK